MVFLKLNSFLSFLEVVVYYNIQSFDALTYIFVLSLRRRSDGLFLQCCREAAEKNPDVKYEEMFLDTTCLGVSSLHFFTSSYNCYYLIFVHIFAVG